MRTQWLDTRAKCKFCTLLGASQWNYSNAPSYYYELWESYVAQKRKIYPWDNRRYALQTETDKMMCKLIHDIYSRCVEQNNNLQLTIQFED